MIDPDPSPSVGPAVPPPGTGSPRLGAWIQGLPPGAGPWIRPVLLLGGGLVLTDGLAHLLPVDGGAVFGLAALAGGWWLLSRRRGTVAARLPADSAGWMCRCEEVLTRFDALEGEATPAQQQRRASLEALRGTAGRQALEMALVSSRPPSTDLQPRFREALRGSGTLRLLWGHPLPATSPDWRWPDGFERCDLLLYHLHLPLQAADLRWLEALPTDQPAWLLIEGPAALPLGAGQDSMPVAGRALEELRSQWTGARPERMLFWDGSTAALSRSLQPLVGWLAREAPALRRSTPLRCFASQHGRWQAELEQLRRREWAALQQRTQWIVAAAVVASPLPSLDVLVLAVANGLMLEEMARLWDCPWRLDQLRAAGLELARASLALGIVEWSSQALLAAVRLHGATWLVGGALQALSAAYLTRVVGHAMADVLALSAGVSEPDLEAIKRQAPVLVARAAEAEKLDWASFLQQGRSWLRQQPLAPAS